MKKSSPFKKLVRWLAYFFIFIAILLGVLYFIAVRHFKESIQYVVNIESGGKYHADAGKADFSLFGKTIILKNVSLHCLDTLNVNQHYEIKFPELYFSFSSWKDLIFKKKILVDSLAVIKPEIFIRVHKYIPDENKQSKAFETNDILNFLEKTLAHFNAHSLSIKDLSFTYSKGNSAPFHADDINVNIVNFTKVDNNDKHILGSDTISVSLGRQHWVMPDGIHELSFKSLNFLSATQKVELDSFTLRQKVTADRPGVKIHGDKFFFNSSHLPALYQKNQLQIDTLYCLNPTLTVINTGQQQTKSNLTDTLNNQAVSHALFQLINIKFIDIINGSYHLKKSELDTSQSGVNRSNAAIYNLVLDNANHKSLTTDSLKINVKDVQFYSKDSMAKLKMAELQLQGRDAIFRNVAFVPSELNNHKRGITFTAPEFLLKNIDIGELLNKRLKAQSGQLIQPDISFQNTAKKNEGAEVVSQNKEDKTTVFLRSLHRIHYLINVDSFGIKNGFAKVMISGKKPLQMNINKLNATILLNKLFKSDSLVDIKHSIPHFQMGVLNLKAKNMNIKVSNYRLDGVNRRNWGDNLDIELANGTSIKGKDIYWEVFDWDVYEKTKEIQVNLLKIGNVYVSTKAKNKSVEEKSPATKELPVIRIAKLEVQNINFNSSSQKSDIQFTGNNLLVENLGTTSHFFKWTNARVNINNVIFKGINNLATIKNISFSSQKETVFTGINFNQESERGKTILFLPSAKLRMQLNTSDFSHFNIDSFTSQNGSLNLLSLSNEKKHENEKRHENKKLHLPDFLLGKLRMNNLKVEYAKEAQTDSMKVKAALYIEFARLQTFKNSQKPVSYKEIKIEGHAIQLDKKNMLMSLPQLSVLMKDGHINEDGNKLSLASFIDVAAKNTAFNYKKDSTALVIKRFDFEFRDPAFQFHQGNKLPWKSLADKITMKGEGFSYAEKKITVLAEDYQVNHLKNLLNFKNFSIRQNESRDTFFKHSPWQNDYIDIAGKALTIDQFNFNNSPKDTSLHIQKIIADGIDLNISRDKSIPFQHNIEKLMPTKLIEKIPVSVNLDSLVLANSSVRYHEFSVATKNWSTIPLTNLNGSITNINNRHSQNDSLRISISVSIFDNHIYQFNYNESYRDSLSGFLAGYNMSPGDLTKFSQFSKPLAAVGIVRGRADTVFAHWKGNKYLAFGKMDFHYSGLKIKVYDKKNLSRQGFIPSLETFVGNLILPHKRRKTSVMYFVRDREKFIFNYWIKTQVSGILSTFGIKKDKKLKKQFDKNPNAHLLMPGK